MGMRRKSREIVVQTLYSLNFVETDSFLGNLDLLNHYPTILEGIIGLDPSNPGENIKTFVNDLIEGIIKKMDEINVLINKYLYHGDTNSVPLLDMAILKLAIYELLQTETHSAVILHEAVEISKKYCNESTGKFLNGILHNINDFVRGKDETKNKV